MSLNKIYGSVKRNKKISLFILFYILSWVLTATVGIARVDAKFESKYAKLQMRGKDGDISIINIPRIEFLDIESMEFYENNPEIPQDGIFRYRSSGYAVAPFLIVDKSAIVWDSSAGKGSMRLNIWLMDLIIIEYDLERYWMM